MSDNLLTDRFGRALVLASSLHSSQVRKGTSIPYISHSLAVCSIVLENGGCEDLAIAALLHDAAEDSGGEETLDLIKKEFGDKVAQIVDDCSDTFESPKPDWEKRKRIYIDRVSEISEDALLVSIADKLHNVRSIYSSYLTFGDVIWERFNGKKEGTIWYYSKLVEKYLERDDGKYGLLITMLEKKLMELKNISA